MPRGPASGVVFAYTTSTSAYGTFVIHILRPVRRKPLPSRVARNCIETTSDPAPRSDIARAPTYSPLTSFGRYRSRCASLPFSRIWFPHRFECAPYDRPIDAEAREIYYMATMWTR